MAEGFQLFRPEALEAQRQAGLGRVLINAPLAHGLVAATAAALVAALFAFLWFAQYTSRIHAQGVLVTAAVSPSDTLDAQLRVPAGAISAVRPGLPVQLRDAVYPYTGLLLSGTVTGIDPVPVAGTRKTTPFYRVMVRLQPVASKGDAVPVLQAGMALHARIELPRRRLLAWLVGDRPAAVHGAPRGSPHTLVHPGATAP